MKGTNFERTLANINYTLNEIKKRGHKTKLYINYIITKENASEEKKISGFWIARGIKDFRVNRMHTRGGNIFVKGMSNISTSKSPNKLCQIFEIFPFITYEEDVLYCSNDLFRKYKIGNIYKDSWETIENRRKKIIKENKWPLNICGKCSDPLRYDMVKNIDKEIYSKLKPKFKFNLTNVSKNI